LGDARWRAGEAAVSRECFDKAAAIARRLSDAEKLAQAAIGAAGVGLAPAVDDAAIRLLEEALASLPQDPTELHVHAMALYSRAVYATDPDKLRSCSVRATQMARELGDTNSLTQ